MGVIAESDSHSTSTTAVSIIDLQSDTMEKKGEGTSLLEWCSLKYNKAISDHRKMREKWWMWNVGPIHPIGINQFI